ncbi:CDP-glycerol glycerophosphotransferase family protein, partial [Campylobacter sp. 2018MI13]|uniref:CDP-glycerol glycerophosphotransferase family protein n=1 Tax=Campylobacter sp. 2018MI13 TaxID=2836737 RepID=UPI001BD94236
FSYREKDGKAKINLLFITRLLKIYNDKKTIKLIKEKKYNAIKLKKEKIKICFFIARPGLWCFDELYKLVIQNQKLEPYIVITPDVFFPQKTMFDFTNKLKIFFEDKGYKNVICGYDLSANKIIDIKNTINPDIIIHTDFMKMHIDNLYYITRFQDKINFLNEYGYSVMEDKLTCNYELNNLVDIYFRPSIIHKEMAKNYMKNNGKNVKIVGSPKIDVIHNKNYLPSNHWKNQNKLKKRIIWAPHHSLKHPDKMYQYNSFLDLYDFMLELANKYKDDIQIAFRPHPMLEVTLSKPEWWGSDRQKEYYQKWDKLENCQYYSDGEFMDLFLTSDAMIMDSCSFMAEYTSCNKPLLHTIGSKTRLGLNEFGEKLYEVCYKTKNDLKQDIIKFIEDVILKENDYLKQERTKFVKKYFSKINGKTASENIYQEILKIIN